MAAKVRWMRDAWWVVTHHRGKRRKKRVGPSKVDKRQAEDVARKINAALTLGTYSAQVDADPLPCDRELRRWHLTYSPTMKATYAKLTEGLIENHLIPHFGARDLRELREGDMLAFIRAKLGVGMAPKTIGNSLSVLRRVLTLLGREGLIATNPASRVGELIRRVDRASAQETTEVQFWSRDEVEALIQTARDREGRFAPLLVLLFATGMRRGEALGIQWTDVDLEHKVITIRRSVTTAGLSTPKSGVSRKVGMTAGLAVELFDLLAARSRECLAKGWREIPTWVFCSEVGTMPDPSNTDRAWRRVRRHAQKEGVRPPQAPLRTAHLGDPRTAVRQERPLGRRSARPLRPCSHPSRVRALDPREGNGPVVCRIRRLPTALYGPYAK